jgi:hypothetical protein
VHQPHHVNDDRHLFGCASFFTPLSGALKSFFFFPMVMRLAVVVVGLEDGGGVGDGMDDDGRLSREEHDAIDGGTEG